MDSCDAEKGPRPACLHLSMLGMKRERGKEETEKRNVYPSWKQRALLTLLCLELVWALGGAGYVRIAYVGYSFAEIPDYSIVGTYVCKFPFIKSLLLDIPSSGCMCVDKRLLQRRFGRKDSMLVMTTFMSYSCIKSLCK